MKSEICNAMTVDVEDYFQVSAFESVIKFEDWDQYPCHIQRNVDRILELFSLSGTRGTFFILGWIAKRYPDVVRAVVAGGHEVASHGYAHVRVTMQSPSEFKRDVDYSKGILEDLSGQEVKGFRAPTFSINSENVWAVDILAECGYRYSSSIYPIRSDLYGMPEAPRFAFQHWDTGLLEIPITTLPLFHKNCPCGGGGYFRLFPYLFSRWALRRVNQREQQPAVFYFHPWELDCDQPRQRGIGARARFRHYTNIGRMDARLTRLLRDFHWSRIDDVFLGTGVRRDQ